MDTTGTQRPSPRPKSVWPMFTVGLLLIAFFAVAGKVVLSANRPAAADEEAARSIQRVEILQKVRAETTAQTTTYAWVDRANGVVRIPVDRAMELAVKKLSAQGAPHPAYPMDPNMPLESAVKPGGLAAAPPAPPPFSAPAPPAPEPEPGQPAPATQPAPEAPPAP